MTPQRSSASAIPKSHPALPAPLNDKEALVQSLYRAFKDHDTDTFMQKLSPQIVWTLQLPRNENWPSGVSFGVPMGGRYEGLVGVARYFENVKRTGIDYKYLWPRALCSTGDEVFVCSDEYLSFPNGTVVHHQPVGVFQVADDGVRRFTAYINPQVFYLGVEPSTL